jgi:hypothetical protein
MLDDSFWHPVHTGHLEQIFDDLLGILVDAVLLGSFVNGVVVVLGGRLEEADVGISVVV